MEPLLQLLSASSLIYEDPPTVLTLCLRQGEEGREGGREGKRWGGRKGGRKIKRGGRWKQLLCCCCLYIQM